jgi:hypothetical protein
MAGTTRPAVEGGAQLQRAFRQAADRLADLQPTHDAAADVGVQAARERAPRVSGALAGTIAREVVTEGAAVIAGSPLVPYAGVINYGWSDRNIEAQPFLTDGTDDIAEAMVKPYIDKVADVVRIFDREAP